MTSGICTDINVIEMGAGSYAASLCGMVLADFGARVVKVEAPGGDRLRTERPSAHLVWNRGKESVVADLRTDEGRAVVRELAAAADIVLDGFSPGTADSWDVGYEQLAALNESLVYTAFSAFGPTGGYRDIKGYDALVAAKAGMFARGAHAPRPGPVLFPQPSASFGAAMQGIAGTVAALLVRDRTGRGQRVDATMVQGIDPVDYFLTMVLQQLRRRDPGATVDFKGGAMAYSRYGMLLASRDGRFVQTSTLLPHQAHALNRVARLDHLNDLPQNAKMPMFETVEAAQDWEDALWIAFREMDLAELEPRLIAEPDVAYELAVTSEEGLDHDQIVHNGNVITIDDPVHGPVRQIGPIAHFRDSPAVIERSAPPIGANNGPLMRPTSTPAAGADHAGAPLSGITIVEFGYFYAMPMATSMLADLGARVIKLEDKSGDPMRTSFGPELGIVKVAAGKESLSLDLRSAAGRTIAHQLLARADAFVLGFRPGVAERLGIDYQAVAAVNPRLLYVHAAGYGTSGPRATRALYAQAAQSVAGSFGRQVGYWLDPEISRDMSVMELQAVIAPRLAHVTDGDSNPALALVAAISLGLLHQQRTGRGQFMSTSMIGGNALAYSDDFNSYEGKVPVPLCDPENMGTSALERLYPADGGWVCLVVKTDREWDRFVAASGATLGDDPRFATHELRRANDAALVDQLTILFSTRTAPQWEATLTAVDVGCVAAREDSQSAFTLDDPVLGDIGRRLEVDHPVFGKVVRSGLPADLSETPGTARPACLRGADNAPILRELGYSDDAIAQLESDGVLFPPEAH